LSGAAVYPSAFELRLNLPFIERLVGLTPVNAKKLDLSDQMRDWSAMTALAHTRAICICGIIIG
jgi:hypothetical protein